MGCVPAFRWRIETSPLHFFFTRAFPALRLSIHRPPPPPLPSPFITLFAVAHIHQAVDEDGPLCRGGMKAMDGDESLSCSRKCPTTTGKLAISYVHTTPTCY
uniref:Uncharacterized protein n=1 Tax=Timema douglasi TaxID=61478 RepID=A0A7R8VD97_TIMDO|nr:unnamed protein product [Timema douglasi]